jgi:hypothetical protein
MPSTKRRPSESNQSSIDHRPRTKARQVSSASSGVGLSQLSAGTVDPARGVTKRLHDIPVFTGARRIDDSKRRWIHHSLGSAGERRGIAVHRCDRPPNSMSRGEMRAELPPALTLVALQLGLDGKEHRDACAAPVRFERVEEKRVGGYAGLGCEALTELSGPW